METSAIELAKTQGLWALLFVILLFWILKENARRESKYQSIIEMLTQKFGNIEKSLENLNEKFERWKK